MDEMTMLCLGVHMADPAAPEPTFAEVFEQLRLSRPGLTQAKLARELGEYEGNISRWRRGHGIDVVKVWKIADYFGVDRSYLARLAGYRDNTPALRNDTDADPEIEALFDAERAEMRADLRGIPHAFHSVILNAQRAARRLAVDSAKTAMELAQGQPISAFETPPISSSPDTSSQDRKKRRKGQNSDLTRGFGFDLAHKHSANALVAVTA